MGIDVTGMHHGSVVVTDFDKARDFYARVLGMEEIAKPSTFKIEVLWFRYGECQMHLLMADHADSISPRHVALHVEDIDAAREHVRQEGALVEETIKIPGADRFFTVDPFGNRIELIHWYEDYGTGR